MLHQSILLEPSKGFAAVVDPLGCEPAATTALRIVTTALQRCLDLNPRDQEELERAIVRADEMIAKRAAVDEALRGAGASLVATTIMGSEGVVQHVGDARLYRIRESAISRLTEDHSYSVDGSDILSRALGMGSIRPSIAKFNIEPGDTLLLLSAGLYRALPESQLVELHKSHGSEPDELTGKLITEAHKAGGRDTILAAVLGV